MNTILVTTKKQSKALVERVLTQHGYPVILKSASLKEVLASANPINPELIILIIEKPDTDLIQQLKIIHQQYPLPIVIFTEQDGEDTIEQIISAGVSAYVVNGLTEERIMTVIKTAVVRFEQYQSVKQEVANLKTNLADRKIVDRAKGKIMAQRQCTEQEAYALLRSSAMNQNMRLATLAQSVVDTSELLTTKKYDKERSAS